MERKEITKRKWRMLIWLCIISGGLIWGISNTMIQRYLTGSTTTNGLLTMCLTAGGILVGWGFGLAYSRFWKVEGID